MFGQTVECPTCNGKIILPEASSLASPKEVIITPRGAVVIRSADPLNSQGANNTPPPSQPPTNDTQRNQPMTLRNKVMLVFLGCIFFFGIASFLFDADEPKSSTSTVAKQTKMSREAFRSAVLGKTPEEVIAAMGKPASTQNYDDGSARSNINFYYDNKTIDPYTSKADYGVQLVFEPFIDLSNGGERRHFRCVRVNF